jgi:dolichol kinase
LAIPAGFDPAPLLYPPAITILVSMLLFVKNPTGFLPGIILSLSSLPRELIPSIGGLDGSNTLHWAFSCLPLFAAETADTASIRAARNQQLIKLDPEVLVLIPPLHQALCVTLHYLTTTSLLPAELQLLSIALIDLLLLASSPQAVILKALLWGGGLGVLVTCVHVLRWGVALARVPKWRFRRTRNSSKPLRARKCLSFGRFGASLFARNVAVSDSSDEEDVLEASRQQHISSARRLSTKDIGRGENEVFENGAISAIDNPPGGSFSWTQRRHTLPTMTNLPARSSQNTPSGRKKRSTSSSIQSFFHLTQSQATVRKWLYAGYVYAWVLVIIFVGIRDYIQKFALQGNEPIGWALGYLLGDISWFRMEVVTANLQRWICLPARSGLENEESCHLGWVEHLRHASFGEANTRLIISGYWLAIIIVGLAIVFRLSTIYEVDTRRKVFHFMMVAMLLPATYVDPTFAALALSLVLSIFLLLDLFRASQLPPLSKSLAYFLTPYVDGRDLKGPVVISHIFLLIGCAIPLWLSLGSLPRIGQNYLAGWEVPTREVSMVSGVICVGMGDAAASLIGRRYGRRKWLWRGGKSIEGSIAFATAVGLALGLAKAWLRIGGWPANNDDSWVMTAWKAGVAAGVASLTEAVLTGGNDNVIVPVVLWLCVKGLDI